MTAIVATPPAALHDTFQPLKIKPIHNDVYDAEEKKRRIFDTPYEPNLEWWTTNQAEYVKPSQDPLPEGYPDQVVSNSVWDGKVLINQRFRVLRGLPVDSWTRSKQISVFAGISAYVSPRRIASPSGDNITHLRDITNIEADKRPPIVVKGQTNGNQVFHNDGSLGIISLFTLGVAETGGLSQLASVGQTYNEFARDRRDIVRELAKTDWKNKYHPEGRRLIHPVGDKHVISVYSRRPYFGFYGADEDVEPLPQEKHLALDAIHFTAEKFSIDLDLEKGDLEYVNNVTVYHARTASEDSEKNQRHLIRLWLDNEEQALPDNLVDEFRAPREGQRWPQEAWD
ncbi:hypothetical protein V866_001483 [Kwoniella sp. B9012]